VGDLNYKKIPGLLCKLWSDKHGPFTWWDGEVIKPVDTCKFISVCTVCMNRIQQLKKTIIDNIEISLNEYPNFEFILLNYNSKDGMDEWVRKHLMKYIEMKKLVYYKTTEPEYFCNAHSRNIAWKLANGCLVTNMDADFRLEQGYLTRINVVAHQCTEKTIFVRSRSTIRGRIVLYKDDFMSLGGFDENLMGYSPWDRDLFDRAITYGFKFAALGGQFGSRLQEVLEEDEDGKEYHPDRGANYKFGNWRDSMFFNRIISSSNILLSRFVANYGRHWGAAKLQKNFDEDVRI